MQQWIRFHFNGHTGFGTLHDGLINVHEGDLFEHPWPTDVTLPLPAVTLLTPCTPSKMIGLWNNFHTRAQVENLQRPAHPLYFLKGNNCFAAHGERIHRPRGYDGAVVFEGELGIVIGRRCADVPESAVDRHIFGYTCVNDVTARQVLKEDPSFVQWSRAKSFDTFGAFGPVISAGMDPDGLTVRTLVNGQEKQNYPVSDMFFSPRAIVSLISRNMTLFPGDIIACGTSVGTGALAPGDRVEIAIDGIGTLANAFDRRQAVSGRPPAVERRQAA